MNHGRAMNSIKQNDWNVLRRRHNEPDDVTGVSIVCLAVCSSVDQRKHQSSTSLAFVDRRIPLRKGQYRGKCFHLMTSSWNSVIVPHYVYGLYHTCTIPWIRYTALRRNTWWRHQVETFSALLAICAGNSPVSGEFPAQRPVTWSFDVFFDLCPNKRLSKQSWGWWFETPSGLLWRHSNDNIESMVHVWYKT